MVNKVCPSSSFSPEEDPFLYSRLYNEETSPQEAWEILSREPVDPKRKQVLIGNAKMYLMNFHFREMPEWMGFPKDHFKAYFLFCHPEALWEEINQSEGKKIDPLLLEELRGESCRDEHGQHFGHKICAWNDPRKYDIIKETKVFGKVDSNGIHPLEMLSDSVEHQQFIDYYLSSIPTETESWRYLTTLMGLNDLTLAKLFAEKRPYALFCINFTSLDTMSTEGKFHFEGDVSKCSPLAIVLSRKKMEDLYFFLDVWDQKMASVFGFSSTFFCALYNVPCRGKVDYWSEVPRILKPFFKGMKLPGKLLDVNSFTMSCLVKINLNCNVIRTDSNFTIRLLLISVRYGTDILIKKLLKLDSQETFTVTLDLVKSTRELLSLEISEGEEDLFYRPLITHIIDAILNVHVSISEVLFRYDCFYPIVVEFGNENDKAYVNKKLREHLIASLVASQVYISETSGFRDFLLIYFRDCPDDVDIPTEMRNLCQKVDLPTVFKSPYFVNLPRPKQFLFLQCAEPKNHNEKRRFYANGALLNLLDADLCNFILSRGVRLLPIDKMKVSSTELWDKVSKLWLTSGGVLPIDVSVVESIHPFDHPIFDFSVIIVNNIRNKKTIIDNFDEKGYLVDPEHSYLLGDGKYPKERRAWIEETRKSFEALSRAGCCEIKVTHPHITADISILSSLDLKGRVKISYKDNQNGEIIKSFYVLLNSRKWRKFYDIIKNPWLERPGCRWVENNKSSPFKFTPDGLSYYTVLGTSGCHKILKRDRHIWPYVSYARVNRDTIIMNFFHEELYQSMCPYMDHYTKADLVPFYEDLREVFPESDGNPDHLSYDPSVINHEETLYDCVYYVQNEKNGYKGKLISYLQLDASSSNAELDQLIKKRAELTDKILQSKSSGRRSSTSSSQSRKRVREGGQTPSKVQRTAESQNGSSQAALEAAEKEYADVVDQIQDIVSAYGLQQGYLHRWESSGTTYNYVEMTNKGAFYLLKRMGALRPIAVNTGITCSSREVPLSSLSL